MSFVGAEWRRVEEWGGEGRGDLTLTAAEAMERELLHRYLRPRVVI
jgi:hypothetical protein